MIIIKDMEMPKRCTKCKFCINQITNDYGSFGECALQKYKKVDCLVWRRDDNCPLSDAKIDYVELPANATNGDVMMKVFKEIQYYSDGRICVNWWNEKYNKQQDGKNK